MRSGMILAAALFWLTPSACFALLFYGGNEPQDSRHYPDWPGIVDVVNNPSRFRFCWCNGNVTHWFQGDSAALQDALDEFAEVEASELQLVLLPGPEQSVTFLGSDDRYHYNWRLYIPRNSDATIDPRKCPWEVHPTLTVYLSDDLDLDSLTVPEGIVVQQWQDLREQYDHEIGLNIKYRRGRAERRLQQLDEHADREGDAAERFREQLAEIDAWVQRRQRNRRLSRRDVLNAQLCMSRQCWRLAPRVDERGTDAKPMHSRSRTNKLYRRLEAVESELRRHAVQELSRSYKVIRRGWHAQTNGMGVANGA